MNTNSSNENIFANGVLLKLTISVWPARLHVPKGAVQAADANQLWLSTTKSLIDHGHLEQLTKLSGEIRKEISGHALPFPLDGFTFVPRKAAPTIEAMLKDYQAKFNTLVNAFVVEFAGYRAEAREKLGNLYRSTDYPMDISRKFGMAWQFITLAAPSAESGILDPETYAAEVKKFQDSMTEARELAVETLRVEFAELVSRAAERLSKPNNVFRDSLIGNFDDFISTFESRNVFNDSTLAELIAKAKSALKGIKPQQLRDNGKLRAKVAGEFAKVNAVIEKNIIPQLRRIVLPGKEVENAA